MNIPCGSTVANTVHRLVRFLTSAMLIGLLLLSGCDGTQDRVQLERIAAVIDQGNHAQAAADLENYVNVYPNDDLAWTILGNVYQELDKFDEAQSAYDSAIKINPEQFQAITGLGVLHRKRGNYDEAMQAYEKAVSINPNYAEAYSSMTTIALKQEDDAKALEYARKGYDLDSKNAVIAANLAIAYHYNNDVENRDKLKRIAGQLGYDKVDTLEQIFSGELTIRD